MNGPTIACLTARSVHEAANRHPSTRMGARHSGDRRTSGGAPVAQLDAVEAAGQHRHRVGMAQPAVGDRLEPGRLLLGDRDADQRIDGVAPVRVIRGSRRSRQRPAERGEHRPMLAHAAEAHARRIHVRLHAAYTRRPETRRSWVSFRR